MGTRQDIATAANTVAGINVSAFYRQTSKVGDGWVALVGLDRDDTGFGFMERWEVQVVLHQDIATAQAWIEANTDALITALAPQLVITGLVPSTLALETGAVPGLVIEGARAH